MKNLSSRRLGIGVLALAGVVAASSAQSPRRPWAQAQREGPVPGVARLMAFGSRSPAQWHSASASKLDGALADLVRHAYLVRPSHVLEDLQGLAPAARFAHSAHGDGPLILVDAVTRGDPQQLGAALVRLGLQHPSLNINDASGWLPVGQIGAAVARSEVQSLRAAMPRTRAGLVTSQGDFAQGSASIRTSWPTLDGTGVKVGVLSSSFDCYAVYAKPGSGVPASGPNGYASNGFTADAAADESTADLSATVTVLEEAGQIINQTCMDYGKPQQLPYGDEGRAMLQIVHDVAPGASLAFYSAVEGEADFANGITALAASGAKVIADDIGYADEPFFQDGIVSQAIDTVTAQGVAYFSAAGNDSNLAYESTSPTFNITPGAGAPNAGERLLNFDTTGATQSPNLPVTIPALVPGEFVLVVVEWDQPYLTGNHVANGSGATSQIDLCAVGVSGNDEILDSNTGLPTTCTGPNAIGADPVQILVIGNPASATSKSTQETLSFNVGVANGTTAPGRIKLAVEDNGAGSTINFSYTPSPTLQGHPGAAGAAAVGAAYFLHTPLCGTSPALLESYSSLGGDPILFDANGNRLAAAVVRQKPDFVGPDGVNDTFLGFVQTGTGGGIVECQNNPAFPSFFGTSAATPHAAGLAALMLQSNSALTSAQVISALRSSASAMGTVPNFQSGYGFIQADAALALLPPPTPTISLSPTTITVGQSATVTWSGVNVTGCTASGSWSGALAASGNQTVTPMASGSLTYTLACTNAASVSPQASAVLAVQPAPMSSGGGGGGLDAAALLAMAALAAARLLRARRRRRVPN